VAWSLAASITIALPLSLALRRLRGAPADDTLAA
jgi:hypothetical protein